MVDLRLRPVMLFLVLVTVLYGSSYQQFLHLDLHDLRGLDDAESYLAMSHGNYQVQAAHRYRQVVPLLASLVQRGLRVVVAWYRGIGELPTATAEELDKLSFYCVNFALIIGTAMLLYASLSRLGFRWPQCLLGTILFLTSRSTVEAAATPLVDSLYYLAIAIITYLTLANRWLLLACLAPLLVLSKETILPFLLLPLCHQGTRRWQTAVGLAASLGVLAVFRSLFVPSGVTTQPSSLVAIACGHARERVLPDLLRLATPAGLHDLLRGYALLGLLAPIGAILNHRKRAYQIPAFVALMVPLALCLALVSGNLGRMFFAAHIPMIAYALIAIECLGRKPDRLVAAPPQPHPASGAPAVASEIDSPAPIS